MTRTLVIPDIHNRVERPRRSSHRSIDTSCLPLSEGNDFAGIENLYRPPSNHFHAVGKRFAIRVNKQWRITFDWTPAGPAEVLFEDYH